MINIFLYFFTGPWCSIDHLNVYGTENSIWFEASLVEFMQQINSVFKIISLYVFCIFSFPYYEIDFI